MIIGQADLLAEFYRENGFKKYIMSSLNETKANSIIFFSGALSVYVVILHLHRCYCWSVVPKNDFEAHLSIIIALASMNVPRGWTSVRNRFFDFFSDGCFLPFMAFLYGLLLAMQLHLYFQQDSEPQRSLSYGNL